MRPVRVPLASYVKARYGAPPPAGGFLTSLPGFLTYFLIGFGILSVLLGFVYLGSSFVANRYEFREVGDRARAGDLLPGGQVDRRDGAVPVGPRRVPAPGLHRSGLLTLLTAPVARSSVC